MPAFGENLRREREMRGVSLEEISSATKISLRFLHAIEQEDFAKLPGGIFSRSFIRSYARYLGLDEERVVAEFQLAAQPQADVDLHRMAPDKATSPRPTAGTPLVATVVAALLMAGGYWLFRYSRRPAEIPTPPAPTPAVTPAPVTPPPPAGPPSSGAAAPGAPSPTGEAPPGVAPGTAGVASPGGTPNAPGRPAAFGYPPTPATLQAGTASGTKPATTSDLVLQIAATETAWVAVDADGKTVLQRLLNPNEVETVRAHKSFDVTTGNAQGTILTLNGETLKPLGRRGETKIVHLTLKDLKDTPP